MKQDLEGLKKIEAHVKICMYAKSSALIWSGSTLYLPTGSGQRIGPHSSTCICIQSSGGIYMYITINIHHVIATTE